MGFFFIIVSVIADFTIELNNTFQDTFINVLDDELNNLKDIHVNKMNINKIDDILPESEDISIEKLTKELEKHVVLEIVAQFI